MIYVSRLKRLEDLPVPSPRSGQPADLVLLNEIRRNERVYGIPYELAKFWLQPLVIDGYDEVELGQAGMKEG